jgi:large-conductance mechanosensitive channel
MQAYDASFVLRPYCRGISMFIDYYINFLFIFFILIFISIPKIKKKRQNCAREKTLHNDHLLDLVSGNR